MGKKQRQQKEQERKREAELEKKNEKKKKNATHGSLQRASMQFIQTIKEQQTRNEIQTSR